jgi:hypothetical protein
MHGNIEAIGNELQIGPGGLTLRNASVDKRCLNVLLNSVEMYTNMKRKY